MDIQESLRIFGLDEKEQEILVLLYHVGYITALTLSRKSHIKRSTLYRVLDRLMEKGLLDVKIDDKTTLYGPANLKQFESIVLSQEARITAMREALGVVTSQVSKLSSKVGDTSVHLYRGAQGLKHMEWRLLDDHPKEAYIIDSGDTWCKTLGDAFVEEIRDRLVSQKIRIFELTNNEFGEKIPTNGVVSWTKNTRYILSYYKHRVIQSDMINIEQDISIFNNTIRFRGYKEGDLVGVEIVSAEYALMFKQLFMMVWNQAKVIDSFG